MIKFSIFLILKWPLRLKKFSLITLVYKFGRSKVLSMDLWTLTPKIFQKKRLRNVVNYLCKSYKACWKMDFELYQAGKLRHRWRKHKRKVIVNWYDIFLLSKQQKVAWKSISSFICPHSYRIASSLGPNSIKIQFARHLKYCITSFVSKLTHSSTIQWIL